MRENVSNEQLSYLESNKEAAISRVADIEGLSISTERIIYNNTAYRAQFLVQDDRTIPLSLKEMLIKHLVDEGLTEQISFRGDCSFVAGNAVKSLKKFLEKDGYAISVLGTESKTSIDFYERKGFSHHIVNLIEGEHVSAAIDLTASYTTENTDAQPNIFGVIAESTADVERIMSKLTNTRWEAR